MIDSSLVDTTLQIVVNGVVSNWHWIKLFLWGLLAILIYAGGTISTIANKKQKELIKDSKFDNIETEIVIKSMLKQMTNAWKYAFVTYLINIQNQGRILECTFLYFISFIILIKCNGLTILGHPITLNALSTLVLYYFWLSAGRKGMKILIDQIPIIKDITNLMKNGADK